jgi:hypothetical protein
MAHRPSLPRARMHWPCLSRALPNARSSGWPTRQASQPAGPGSPTVRVAAFPGLLATAPSRRPPAAIAPSRACARPSALHSTIGSARTRFRPRPAPPPQGQRALANKYPLHTAGLILECSDCTSTIDHVPQLESVTDSVPRGSQAVSTQCSGDRDLPSLSAAAPGPREQQP